MKTLSEFKDARAALTDMVQGLRDNSRVHDVEVRFPEPCDAATLKWAKDKAKGELPEGYEAFLKSMDGFRLEWKFDPEGEAANDRHGGYVNLLPVRRVLGSWKGTTWFEDQPNGDEYRNVLPVDHFMPEACTAFVRNEKGEMEDALAYHYLGESLETLALDFTEYLDLLLNSRGLFYWMTSLCAPEQESWEAKAFRERMPTLFDDFEASRFTPRKEKSK